MATKNDATVLAFEKKLVPSDGYLYGTLWDQRSNIANTAPLKLNEKSVRGTISNRLKSTMQNDPLKLNAEIEKANLQTVDACALPEGMDTLKLGFTLKVLGGIDKPSASNGPEFNATYPMVARKYIERHGFTELAKRYATNIANARYLWRNRVGAEKLEVVVQVQPNEKLVFDASEISTRSFNNKDAQVDQLAARIAEALAGNLQYLVLRIEAFALIGKGQEVYPSEELVLDKGKGNKSKVLYDVDGVAALHSQKIGNAIRTIDTWYPGFEDPTIGVGPIAIEPYGAVTNLGKAFRNPKNKADFYTLFDRFAMGEKLDRDEDEHYVMAVLVRGGVFGQSGKE